MSAVVATEARTFIRRFHTFSGAVAVKCSDGQTYIIKAPRIDQDVQRSLFNDFICGQIGMAMGVAVPQTTVVLLPQDLINLNPDPANGMGHMKAGLCHASSYIEDVTERVDSLSSPDEGDNRQRYARLAVFFGLLGATDRQFIFKTQPPRLVYSHDHGHFLGGPNWTIADLEGLPPPEPLDEIVSTLGLSAREISEAAAFLSAATDKVLEDAVAKMPATWNVTEEEAKTAIKIIGDRRNSMIASFAKPVMEEPDDD